MPWTNDQPQGKKENAFFALFSFNKFQKAVYRYVFEKFYRGEDQHLPWHRILSDGSINYRENIAKTCVDRSRKQVIYAKTSMNNFTVDPKIFDRWNHFIAMMQHDKVKIVFFLPPYDPFAYVTYKETNWEKNIVTMEEMLRDNALRNGIPVIGSYDPAKFALKEKDFFDGMHAKGEVTEKIFKPYLNTIFR
ncbi:MAG: hypothetical protein HQL26_07725 [Candidatus Omnitrophica bacterium]|nr:hypothetical protein [Candidatus Omnitrophota bacterium]